jgi:hypothetical protein
VKLAFTLYDTARTAKASGIDFLSRQRVDDPLARVPELSHQRLQLRRR